MVRALQAVIISATIVIAFMFGAIFLDTVSETAGTGTSAGGNTTEIVGVEGGSASFSSNPVTSFQFAKTSLNESVELTGSPGSNVTINAGSDVGTDFSACTWGELDSTVVSNNENATLLTTESAVLWYNGSDDTWNGYYYNVSSRNSYTTSASATSPTTPPSGPSGRRSIGSSARRTSRSANAPTSSPWFSGVRNACFWSSSPNA